MTRLVVLALAVTFLAPLFAWSGSDRIDYACQLDPAFVFRNIIEGRCQVPIGILPDQGSVTVFATVPVAVGGARGAAGGQPADPCLPFVEHGYRVSQGGALDSAAPAGVFVAMSGSTPGQLSLYVKNESGSPQSDLYVGFVWQCVKGIK